MAGGFPNPEAMLQVLAGQDLDAQLDLPESTPEESRNNAEEMKSALIVRLANEYEMTLTARNSLVITELGLEEGMDKLAIYSIFDKHTTAIKDRLRIMLQGAKPAE